MTLVMLLALWSAPALAQAPVFFDDFEGDALLPVRSCTRFKEATNALNTGFQTPHQRKPKMKNSLIALLGLLSAPAFAQQGEWEPWLHFGNDPFGADAIIAVNLIHVFDGTQGKVIAITFGEYNNPFDPCEQTCLPLCRGKVYVWTPPTMSDPSGYPGTFQWIPNCHNDLFCAGHSALADGRILVVGGNSFQPVADLFDPVFSAWNSPSTPSNMQWDRWYPTATTLWDGKVLVTSGFLNGTHGPTVLTPELYNPGANAFTQLPNANIPDGEALYPWMFLLPDGNLVKAGHGNARMLAVPDPNNPSTWSWGSYVPNPQWPNPLPPPPDANGSAVMYSPGKIMKCGGNYPGVATTHVIDLNNADPNSPPAWLSARSMTYARADHNLVVLPDGKVLAVGGGSSHDDPNATAVFHAEMFDPASGGWSLMAASDPDHPRMYHSTAMLLPDGRVVSAGANNFRTAQIFKPPYLTGNPPPPRPTIVSAPSYMQYGQEYSITYLPNEGPDASVACLIRLASVTHSFDQDQRPVPLKVIEGPTGILPSISVMAPDNGNIAPPGYYMLFILNEYARNQFAPCELAAYVQVGP